MLKGKNIDFKFLFFSFASLSAGVFNYLFQIYAGKTLTSFTFGELSAWLAYVAIFSIVGTVIQVASNYIHFSEKIIRKISISFLVLTLFLLSFLPDNLFYLGILFVILSAIYSWQLGFLQSQKAFYFIGTLSIFSGLARLFGAMLLVHLNGPILPALAKPQVVSILLSLFAFGAYFVFSKSFKAPKEQDFGRSELISILLISFLYTLIPQFDVLIANTLLTKETLGTFARAAVISKAILFGLFIVAQYLLPNRNSALSKAFIKKVFLIFCVLFALIGVSTWILGPVILNLVFSGLDFGNPIWISLLSCSALVACSLLIALQFYLPKNKSVWALLVAAYFPTTYVLFYFVQSEIENYLIFNVSFLLIIFSFFTWRLYKQST